MQQLYSYAEPRKNPVPCLNPKETRFDLASRTVPRTVQRRHSSKLSYMTAKKTVLERWNDAETLITDVHRRRRMDPKKRVSQGINTLCVRIRTHARQQQKKVLRKIHKNFEGRISS